MPAAEATPGLADDVVGTGEEEFEVGMKQNAMERDAADADGDGKLDVAEFMQLVRDRDEAEHTDDELAARFKALDEDGSGKIDMPEFLQFSLREALQRSTERVCDLFKKWDEDGSGKINKKEFRRAIKALGFPYISEKDVDAVFDSLDEDKSGELEYKELNAALRKGAGSEKVTANLKRGKERGQRDGGRGAKLTSRNLNANFAGSRVAALPPMVQLDPSQGSVPEQLNLILSEHNVKLIDLFREWDDDGNGAIDKKEFRAAIADLGYDVSKKEANAAFALLDDSGDVR